jgi:hypothetical protein
VVYEDGRLKATGKRKATTGRACSRAGQLSEILEGPDLLEHFEREFAAARKAGA